MKLSIVPSLTVIFTGLLIVGVVALVAWRIRTWRAMDRSLTRELETRRRPLKQLTYDPAETVGLPAPVRRYFEVALCPGQPLVAAVTMEHEGEIDLGGDRPNWKRFSSFQRVTLSPPGFGWFARVPLVPGVSAEARDVYVGGRGILRVRAMGIMPLVDIEDTEAINKGELMRFLAEGAWYPTALLPSQGVIWDAVDATSAQATLVDGTTRISLLFRFGPSGLIESVRAEDRPMMEKDGIRPMPWEGRWTGEIKVDGMRVPREGEVAWLFPEGRKPYWRGRATRIRYEFAGDPAPFPEGFDSSG